MKSVQKSVFSTVIVIALVTILLIPTSPTHIVVAVVRRELVLVLQVLLAQQGAAQLAQVAIIRCQAVMRRALYQAQIVV